MSSMQPHRAMFENPIGTNFRPLLQAVLQPRGLVRTSQSTPNTAHLGASGVDLGKVTHATRELSGAANAYVFFGD